MEWASGRHAAGPLRWRIARPVSCVHGVGRRRTSACVIYVLAVGRSPGRELSAPEGPAISSDGASVYGAAFKSDAVDVFNRNMDSGALIQKSHRAGCVTCAAPMHALRAPQPRSAAHGSEAPHALVTGVWAALLQWWQRGESGCITPTGAGAALIPPGVSRPTRHRAHAHRDATPVTISALSDRIVIILRRAVHLCWMCVVVKRNRSDAP